MPFVKGLKYLLSGKIKLSVIAKKMSKYQLSVKIVGEYHLTPSRPSGMVWCRMVRYGMVWYGVVWYGMVWYGTVRYGMVW